ncbi:MAG: hypothetical protein R2838_20895 [Caldilineaceae bacterium]
MAALTALKAKYVKAATLVPDYLPYYNNALGMRGQFTQIAVDLLRKYKASKKVNDVRVYLVDQRDNKFLPEIEAWKAMALERIRTGQPFNAKQVKDPKAILAAYAHQWRRAAGGSLLPGANDGSAQPAAGESVRNGLDSPANRWMLRRAPSWSRAWDGLQPRACTRTGRPRPVPKP